MELLAALSRLLGNVDTDRDVSATILSIRDVGSGVDFEFAFDGCVLINDKGHRFALRRFLSELLPLGSLAANGKSKRILANGCDLSGNGQLRRGGLDGSGWLSLVS